MAKINVKFNNKEYQIKEAAFDEGKAKVVTHLTGEMKGTGATVKFGSTAYDVDSTKLNSSAAALAAHLGAIVGSGVRIVIGGVEYGVDSEKVAGAVTEVETTLVNLSQPVFSKGLEYTSNGDGTCYVSGIGTCSDTDVVIPSVSPEGDTVTGIGNSAFKDCRSLASITIPDSVTGIGKWAFENCYSLTSITIPNSVTSIDERAFDSCTSLTSITIPNSVTSIGDMAFLGSNSVERVYISDLVSWCNITFVESRSTPCHAGVDLYLNGEKLTELVIPDTVTAIKSYAFAGCTSLTSVTIPEGVTSIGDWAFYDCTSLTSAIIPDSVTHLGDNAFAYCTSLASITIGNGVTSIASNTFANCTLIESITYNGTMAEWEAIEKGRRWDEDFVYYIVHCSDGEVDDISKGLEYELNSDEKNYSVTGIGEFSGSNLVIPATYKGKPVTSIGSDAFSGCTSLTSITIPNSVTSIGGNAFSYNFSLTDITYNGTKAQWEAIEKGSDWGFAEVDYTIHCTNGDIFVEGSM